MSASIRTSLLLFLGVVAAIYTTALLLSVRLPDISNPQALAVGISLDLVLVVPLAFYFLVMRPRRLAPAMLAPVVLVSLVAATLILPREYHQTLRLLEAVVIPLELGLIGWVVWRTARALRKAGGVAADPVVHIQEVMREVVPVRRAAEIIAAEVALFFYLFARWRARPHTPDGAAAISYHRRSGHGGIVFGLLVLTAAEMFALHLLLARWSEVVAWVVTLASLYGALWLIADWRATLLRPVLVQGQELWLRAGLRWSVRVPIAAVRSVERREPRGIATMQTSLITPPSMLLVFAEPVTVEGPYGLRRRVQAIGLVPDEPERLRQLLGEAGA